jgi:hypothetical protein
MTPNPKKKRVDLPPKEYQQLRARVYMRSRCSCEICGQWMSYEEMSLHHIVTKGAGGDDVDSNVLGVHLKCHPD